MSVIFTLSILGACGHSEADYKAVYDKIENDEELNASDYDLMIDYIDDMASSISKVKNEKDLEKLEGKYEYADVFMKALLYGNPSDEIKSKLEAKAKKMYKNFEKAKKEAMKNISSSSKDDDDDNDDDDDDDSDDDW